MVDLDELERLEREATPGPWKIDREELGVDFEDEEQERAFPERIGPFDVAGHDSDDVYKTEVDAVLVAYTRNALPDLIAELRTLRATIKDAWETLGGEWKDCDATLGEAIAAELGEYDEANPEALSATLRENERLRARVAEMERDARLGAVVREAVGTFGPSEVESVEDITISDDGEPDGCREVIIISDEQASILSEIADALRAEEGSDQ